jgi:hypothetical protein
MSILFLPYEIIYLVVENLSISQLIFLYRVCKFFRRFFRTYFAQQKRLDDPLIPKEWSPIQKYAALKSRTDLFPEARFFVDLTILLIRSFEKNDLVNFNLFWSIVLKMEDNNPSESPIGYPLLIEKTFLMGVDCAYLDLFLTRYQVSMEYLIRFFYYLASSVKDFSRRYSLDKLYRKHVTYIWQKNLDLTNLPKYSDNQPTLDSHLAITYLEGREHLRPIVDAILDNRNDDLISLLRDRCISETEITYALCLGATLAGRKDLFLFLKSELGYIPYYDWTDCILEYLGMQGMRNWLMKNIYSSNY